jgi:hypothetical protein
MTDERKPVWEETFSVEINEYLWPDLPPAVAVTISPQRKHHDSVAHMGFLCIGKPEDRADMLAIAKMWRATPELVQALKSLLNLFEGPPILATCLVPGAKRSAYEALHKAGILP